MGHTMNVAQLRNILDGLNPNAIITLTVRDPDGYTDVDTELYVCMPETYAHSNVQFVCITDDDIDARG